MVKHVVFFRLLDEAEGCTKLENAQIIRDGLLALKDKIDVLVDETVGPPHPVSLRPPRPL